MLRIGQGYDLHRVTPGRPLRLGGITIPAPFGLDGHSDADVLLHAVIDAMLGSMALGDIGGWFPDTDPQWLGVDSRVLLQTVLDDPRMAAWHLVNLDCTIIAEHPKLAPWRSPIQQSLAAQFGVPPECISIKAKTNEGVDAVGSGEAIAAWAVLLATNNPTP